MSTKSLLVELKKENIKISLNNGELNVLAKNGEIKQELIEKINKYKSNLVDLLASVKDRKVSCLPKKIDRNKSIPISFSQYGLWFLNKLEGDSGSQYNIAYELSMNGDLNVSAILNSIKKIVNRHESFKTIFRSVDNAIMQEINNDLVLNIPVENIDEKDLKYHTKEHAIHNFNLLKGPLIRVTLLNISPHNHILLLNIHHSIFDGWSMGIFIKELSILYKADVCGNNSTLPPLPFQFADFAHWQRQWLQGENLASQINYWRKKLQGVPDLLTLPTDRPRPHKQSNQGKFYRFSLSRSLATALNRISRSKGISLFMTLLTGLNILLARYSRQTDICIGTLVSNRRRKEFENLIGYFANTLVLRTQWKGDPVIDELLQQIKDTTLSAYEFQDIPFEYVVDIVNPERSLSYTPLFQVLFLFQNAFKSTINLPGIIQTSIKLSDIHASNYDLTVDLTELDGEIEGIIQYRTELFNASTIDRFCNHYRILLEGITKDQSQRQSNLPLLTKYERQQILIDWNNTKISNLQEKCVHHLFEEQVKKTPDAIAIVFNGKQLTYEKLNVESNQLAHYLIQQGLKSNQSIGIYFEQRWYAIIAILGTIKAGCAYLPLDASYPNDRVIYMLEDSNASFLLTQQVLLNRLDSYSKSCFCLDYFYLLKALSTRNPTNISTVDDFLYIVYTSGSTGQPKGVQVSHYSELNLLYWYTNELLLDNTNRCLLISSIGFDLTQKNIFSTLSTGGALILPCFQYYDPHSIISLIQYCRITLINCTPSMFYPLVDQTGGSDKLNSLRFVVLGGEPFDIEPLLSWLGSPHSRCEIINSYGPTECTDIATFFRIDNPQVFSNNSIPLGKPINNVFLRVVDQYGGLCPVGIPGELLIGGSGISGGYLGQPKLTKEKFVQDCFSHSTAETVYRTGDLVSWLPDGNLHFIDRIDNQIKIRGFRVELEEIESALKQQEHVLDAIASTFLNENNYSDQNIVAYLLIDHSKREVFDKNLLRTSLQKRLPSYMIPGFFIILDKFPINTHGKVDRKALPLPNRESLLLQSYIAPCTEIERSLVKIWAKILKLSTDKIGINNSFFQLGGNSLLATKLIRQIQKVFNVSIEIRDLFDNNNINSLASVIELYQDNSHISDLETYPLNKIDRDNAILLSFGQQRLWFINQLQGGKETLYNIPWALRLTGYLNIAALEKTLNTIIRRQESFKTSFFFIDGEVVQLISDNLFIKLPVKEISEVDIKSHLSNNANHIFSLSEAPLLKVDLFRLASRTHILAINIHHIIADGWSIGIFYEEMSNLYSAYSNYQELCQEPLPIQYIDFSYWQRQWLKGKMLLKQIDYWKKQLNGSPKLLNLPTDKTRPAIQTYQGQSIYFTLSKTLTEKLNDLSFKEGITLFMALITGFIILLTRYTDQKDVCVGTPIANRQRPELDKIIGFFVNTLVLRTKITNYTTCKELFQLIKGTTLSAYAHQDVPFEHLVEVLQPERSLSFVSLFQVMFVLQNMEIETLKLPNIEVSEIKNEILTAKFDLTVSLMESNQVIEGAVEFNADLFNRSTIERLIDNYKTILKSLVDKPDDFVSEITVLTQSERQKILYDWNNTEAVFPLIKPIYQLFEDQVEIHSNAVAVEFDRHFLTYGVLNCKSNQLAHYLVNLGVRPEIKVGICVNRSLDMIIALLGILKAGGAYVPIDPTNPIDRIYYILKDSQINLLITYADTLNRYQVGLGINCIVLDDVFNNKSCKEMNNPNIAVSSKNLAYIIYTSGSTGSSKGSLTTHENITRLFLSTNDKFHFGSNDVWSLFHSLAFDFSVWEFWGALAYGGKLVVIPYWISREPERFYRLVCEKCITVLNHTPSAFLQFILAEKAQHIKKNQLRVRYVIFGGEALDINSLVPWVERHSNHLPKIVNMYGITETTVHVSYYKIDFSSVHNVGSLIGKHLDDLKCYVLDNNMNPTPIGIPGELYVGGKGIMRGYHRRADMTAECIMPNPFSLEPGMRLYKTGDRVRYLPDGCMEFIGRNDNQIKIRGFRIELGEIESAILIQKGVRDASVLVRTDGENTGNQHIIAYIVGDFSLKSDHSILRAALQEKLPEYMIPSFFIFLDKFPLTSNGKVDHTALLRLEGSVFSARGYVPPKTQTERVLLAIWENILNVSADKIGTKDSFFELGGHSLLAAKLVSQLRNAFNLDMPLRMIFECPTISGLASFLDNNSVSQKHNTTIDLKKEAILDRTINAENIPCFTGCKPMKIFLTGSTGFLGRFLLRELLEKTCATLYCLIRGKSREQAFERLKLNMLTNQLWSPKYTSRIRVLLGDISKPFLGLNEAEFFYCSNNIDIIYHNATEMNHISSYRKVKAAIVGGTQEILRLASTHHLKPVHYSSTVSVFSRTYSGNNKIRTVDEYSSIDFEQHFSLHGYTSGKWVSEKIVMLAQDRGIPCRIYRFGLIAGDTEKGRYDANQWLYRLIASSIKIGFYPIDYCSAIGLLPVDIAVKSMVFLSFKTSMKQSIFHLSNPHKIDICEFFEVYNQLYCHVEPLVGLPFDQWLRKIQVFFENNRACGQNTSIYPLMLHYSSKDHGELAHEQSAGYPIKDADVKSHLTLTILERGGIRIPKMNKLLLKKYLKYLLVSSTEND